FLLWLLSGFARSGFAQVGSETDVSWEKRTILSKTLSIRAFFNTGNKDSSINRASGNTFKTRLLPTDESYVFFLGSAVKPVLDTEYEILQDRLGVLWARLIVGGGGGYFYGDTYLALVFNYGYLNNEDLYNIANEDNPKYNAVMEGQGLKMILQTDRMSLTMNQREFRGSTDSVKLDAVSHEARFSFKFYDQGNALFLNSAAWRLYHDIHHKNTGEIGLVWRTDNPGWISLFSGLELGLLVLFDFEKTGNEFWNLGLDVNLGDF
ncbi:MAG: hypothetical protein GY866_07205, partial [Proteobacteria bacterium]|nr:hypothetical protein [Pseudomonadota bacterium]